jgi:TPR repeat protein
MNLIPCGRGGGELRRPSVVCPSRGVAVTPSASTGPSAQKSASGFNRIVVVGIVAAGLLVGFLFATWFGPRPRSKTPPAVPEVIDLETLRGKAGRGDAKAQRAFGEVYARGQGVKQDYAQAAKWYRQAAEQGNPKAQAALGELYEAGQGVSQDNAEAARWYRRAAEQGYAASQYSLAVMYVMGTGVPQNAAEAVKWYRQAADQGNPLAEYNLGMRYYEGNGVAADPVEAYKWLSLAAAQGISDAEKTRTELQKKMSREQIKEGRRRAEAMTAKTLGH